MANYGSNLLFVQRSLLVLSIALSQLLLAFNVHASGSQLYRYKDEHGNIVLNRTIPPKFVGQGYDILNDQGRLITQVPPALSEQEIAIRDAEIERQKQRRLAQEKQDIIDDELKQLYSHPNDAVRILKRRVQDILGVIQIKKNQIETTNKEILEQQGIAAERQRNGLAIPDSLTGKIAKLKKDAINAKADIAELNEEMVKVLQEFDGKIKRLEVITQQKASDYQALLDSLDPSKKPPLNTGKAPENSQK